MADSSSNSGMTAIVAIVAVLAILAGIYFFMQSSGGGAPATPDAPDIEVNLGD